MPSLGCPKRLTASTPLLPPENRDPEFHSTGPLPVSWWCCHDRHLSFKSRVLSLPVCTLYTSARLLAIWSLLALPCCDVSLGRRAWLWVSLVHGRLRLFRQGVLDMPLFLMGALWGRFPRVLLLETNASHPSRASPGTHVQGSPGHTPREGNWPVVGPLRPADRQTECVQSSSGAAAAAACVSSRSPRGAPVDAARLQRCARTLSEAEGAGTHVSPRSPRA